MSQRLNEYFAGEAADYLQQLSLLLSAPVAPDPVRLLRLVTGVRGSTQMAGADDLADLASHFETSARAFLQGSMQWSDELGELTRRTVGEMQALVYSIDRWGEEEASRIRAIKRLWTRGEGEAPDEGGVAVVPIESLYFEDEGPHVIETPGGEGPPLERVPVTQLLYGGTSALLAARSLRPAFEAAVRAGDAGSDRLLLLIDELFDLLDLGIGAEASEV